MKKLAVAMALGVVLGLAGCSSFSYPVGVQQYGMVTGTLVDATTSQPVGGAGANVSCGGQATHPDANGGFTLTQVPIGDQTCYISAVGYATQSPTATVVANQTYQLGLIKLQRTP
ncbi:MAG: carboxypeptidase-like regulatory domain-containing protein [bacterium]|nr:carboxypeptidase-like regulatory domain-containing protein [bacterium]